MSFVTEKEIQSFPLPPGNLGLPIIREFLFLKDGGPIDFAKKRHKKYGSIFKSSLFGQPTIFVCGAEACRFVLDNENKYFINNLPSNVKAIAGDCIITQTKKETHKNRRQILRKVFTSQYIAKQIKTIEDITENYCQKWESQGEITWYPELVDYTFDIACRIYIGLDKASETTNLGHLYKTLKKGYSSFIPLPWTKLGRALKSRQELLSQMEEMIDQRYREPSLQEREDALNLLIQARDEEGNPLSKVEIQDQIANLITAGHGSLASALNSFCFFLAQNPDILEKCRQEQKSLDFSAPLTLENLKKMTYLDKVIKEVLRRMPAVLAGFRTIIKDCSFQGYLFPKGWQAVFQIPVNHLDSKLFTQPNTFNPERFDTNSQDNLDAYIPYGGGRRRCLGESLASLEIKIFAVNLIRKYSWELVENQNLEIDWYPVPRPKDGLKVHFRHL